MADRNEWKKIIEEACVDAGTYKPFFDSVIDSLALIMEARDSAQAEFEADGCIATIEYTNKGGATNTVKNPSLQVASEQHKIALSYWKELGLTPKGFQTLKEANAELAVHEKSQLDKALEKLGKEL